MSLSEELERIGEVAAARANEDEWLSGVLVAEPREGARVYLCSFSGNGACRWLALDGHGRPVGSRTLVRDAASIAALCEVAEETAAGGDLDELSSRLVALRLTENPPGIEEAEEAVRELQRAIDAPPRIASPAYLDRIGLATRRLEQALGEGGSPFAEAMKHALAAVDRLVSEIEDNYKGDLT
jgi:hypothetical protein